MADDDDQHWYGFTSNQFSGKQPIYRFGSLALAIRHIHLLNHIYSGYNWKCSIDSTKTDKPEKYVSFEWFISDYTIHGV